MIWEVRLEGRIRKDNLEEEGQLLSKAVCLWVLPWVCGSLGAWGCYNSSRCLLSYATHNRDACEKFIVRQFMGVWVFVFMCVCLCTHMRVEVRGWFRCLPQLLSTPSTPLLSVYVCVCIWVSVYVLCVYVNVCSCLCARMYVHVEAKGWCWVSSTMTLHLIFWDMISCWNPHCTWDLPSNCPVFFYYTVCD